jgi:hypothetical protein
MASTDLSYEQIIIEIENNSKEESNINAEDNPKEESNCISIYFRRHPPRDENNWIIVIYYLLFMPHINLEPIPHICSLCGIILFIPILIYYIIWGLWALFVSIIFSLMLFLSMFIIIPYLICKVIRDDDNFFVNFFLYLKIYIYKYKYKHIYKHKYKHIYKYKPFNLESSLKWNFALKVI